jgi:sterol O-acyltransferase
MAQIPLIAVGRLPAIKNNALAGNVLFWLGLLSGFPLLAIGYVSPPLLPAQLQPPHARERS